MSRYDHKIETSLEGIEHLSFFLFHILIEGSGGQRSTTSAQGNVNRKGCNLDLLLFGLQTYDW